MAALTISLRKKLVRIHETRRRKNAVRYLRQEIARYTKVDAEAVKLGMDVNEYMIRNVALNMKPVMLNIEKSPAGVTAHLADSLKNWNKSATPAAAPAKAAPAKGGAPALPSKKEAKADAKQAAKPEAPKTQAKPAPKPTEPKKAKPDEKKQV